MAAETFSDTEITAFKTFMLANPGVLEMSYGDKRYKFSSLKEQAEHLAFMERRRASGYTGGVRYAATSKGV